MDIVLKKDQWGLEDFQARAEQAAEKGDWRTAVEYYSRCVDQRAAELELITSVQEGLSSKLDMQGIYDLVGDKLRDTFDAQVVMISQYDLNTKKYSIIMLLRTASTCTYRAGIQWIPPGRRSSGAVNHS